MRNCTIQKHFIVTTLQIKHVVVLLYAVILMIFLIEDYELKVTSILG